MHEVMRHSAKILKPRPPIGLSYIFGHTFRSDAELSKAVR